MANQNQDKAGVPVDAMAVKAEPMAIRDAHRTRGENTIVKGVEIGKAVRAWREANKDKNKAGKDVLGTFEALSKLNKVSVSSLQEYDKVYEASEYCETLRALPTWKAAVRMASVILDCKDTIITIAYK